MSNIWKTYSDQELISLFKLYNDEQAIAALIHRYKQNIFSTIYLKVRDKYLAEDLFQETFLKIINNIRNDKYADQGKFLPWAIRIAQNLCIDYFRKAKQQQKIVLKEDYEVFEYLMVDNKNASVLIEKKETESALQRLLEKLPPEQKEVVILRIYGELSFREIAEATNVGINTALGRMRYALINLKSMIGQDSMVLR